MPHFVRIGAIRTNLSGVGSRGYHLMRCGRIVISRWGAVEVLPGRKFRWAYKPQERRYSCPSEKLAKKKLAMLVEKRAKEYSKLPTGARIR